MILVLSSLGSAYGAAKIGVGVCTMGVCRPELLMKSIIPIVMSGIMGIYGLIISIMMISKLTPMNYEKAYRFLGAGMGCGLSCLSAGIAIGIMGDAGVRANA